MLLVATPRAKAQVTEQKVARAFLPIDLEKTKRRSRDIHLDEELLGRPRSQLRLQPSKIRTYVLVGTRGKDFLDTIERDVKLIASERRAFLLPDGLGSDSPLKALFVGSDSEVPCAGTSGCRSPEGRTLRRWCRHLQSFSFRRTLGPAGRGRLVPKSTRTPVYASDQSRAVAGIHRACDASLVCVHAGGRHSYCTPYLEAP